MQKDRIKDSIGLPLPNKPAAGNAGIAPRLVIEHHRPDVPEPGRRFEFMRMNLLWPLGTLLALLTIGCGGTKQSPEELKIGANVPLAASDAEDPEWIGIAGGKGQGERALFEKVIELKRPVPRGGSIGTHLQMREGAPLPSVLVYRGTNRWAEDNVFVGEFRVREWPRPDEKSVIARVGFQITEQHELLMWLQDPGPDRKGVANPEYAVPIPISRVTIDGTSGLSQ